MAKSKSPAPAGMGAIVHPEGVAFRVWAPNAKKVYVAGTFNDWSEQSYPLTPEENGYWAANVPEAKIGDQYRYLIVNGSQKLWRNDPYAREVTNSVGNSVIVDPNFDWGEDNFEMPPWNTLIIYEMHVGTFNTSPGVPGSFESVIERLSYLQQLGINAIELMPPMEFPGGYSWGYNPSHPLPWRATMEAVRALKPW